MSATEVKATEYVCDGCQKAFVVVDGEELPLGFHIKSVFWINGGGGDGVSDVFACRSACLKKAVENKFSADFDRDR